MRTRTLGLVLLAALLPLAGCTSDPAEPPAPTTEDDAAVTTESGLEGQEGNAGWYCRYLNTATLETALGEESTTPRELVVSDTADEWVCDVLNGGIGDQEPALRVSILLGEDAVGEARTRAEDLDGTVPGPAHLGESYLSPGLVTALTACRLPTAERLDDYGPLAVTFESFHSDDETTTENLRQAASQAAQQLDQSLGCSPRLAREQVGLTSGISDG